MKENKDQVTIEGDERKLVVKRINDETLEITEHSPEYTQVSNSVDSIAEPYKKELIEKGSAVYTWPQGRKSVMKLLDDGKVESVTSGPSTEFVLPISIVEQEIPEERGNPGVVYVKDGWAYPWGDKSTIDAYKASLKGIAGDEAQHSGFHDGLPERVKEGNLSVESGYLASWGNGTHFRTEDEAVKRASELSETTKGLDTPSIESMHGMITPRERHLLEKIVHTVNAQPYGWDEESGPSMDDWLYSAGFTNDVESLKWAIENLPRPQEEYDAIINGWGGPEKEADRLKKLVAESILERIEKK